MCKTTVRTLCHSMALWLLLGLVLFPALAASAATLTFTFTLPGNCTTSAGAFDTNGNLVRTIWRRVPYVSGPHTVTWDGKKDDGSNAPAGTYTIKVLYHNMQYVWDGTVGNTSSSFDGESAWFTHHIPRGMAIDGTAGFVATGYAEGRAGIKRFTTTAPQSGVNASAIASDTEWAHIATDGTRFYAADTGNGWDTSNVTLVQSYNVSDNSVATFTNGQNITKTSPWSTNFPSAIDVAVQTTPPGFDPAFVALNASTGIAVQKSGNVLAVAHGPLNVVRLFNKTSGASLGNITVTAPIGLGFTNTGDLLVCTASSVKRYTGVGTSNTLSNTINTSQPAIAVAAHPTTGNDVVIVAVAGTSQQIKAYTAAGTALWTYGTAGGYTTGGPAVATNKFGFGGNVPLAMQSDGSFWVYDAATMRMLHISATRTYLEQIAYLMGGLTTAVDIGNPTRVFGKEWLEYSVDYTKPLLPGDPQATGGNKSWKLVRNWAAGMPSKYLRNSTNGDTFPAGLNTVATLTNPANPAEKRTFAFAIDCDSGAQGLLELPASGAARDTGIQFTQTYAPGSSYSLYANGDLRYATYTNDPGGNPIQTIYKQPLSSFDASGNPVWGTAVALATTPAGPKDPIGGRGWSGIAPWQFPVTSSNVVVSFDQSEGGSNDAYHLGGAQVGSSSTGWKWLGSPAYSNNVPLDGLGSFPWGGIQYGGNKVMATDRNIVYGFHGEFWNGSQADQFMHFYDDGLFVGQFGVPGDVNIPGTGNIGGKGGNAITPTLVTYSGETYLWHGNESPIGGLQRWHLVGANSIREMQGSGALGGSVTLTDPGSPFPTGLTATPGTSQVALIWQAVPGSASYKVKRATHSGGPYTTVTTVTNATYTNTGLTNGTKYYYVVSAVDGSSVESANSSQVSAVPFNTTQLVQLAGEATYLGSSTSSFNVDSTAPAKGQAALTLQSVFDQMGNLSLSSMGTKGYVLFGWSGIGSTTTNLLPGITATPDGTWGDTGFVSQKFVVDGVDQWSDGQGNHAWRTGGASTMNINVSDSNWHYMTVFSPDVFADNRNQTITLTPQGASTPSVTYTALDPAYPGFGRIYQFRFKGNVTMTVQRGSNDNSGLVSAVFFDDVPVSTAPALPVAPTLTATAGNAKVTLSWPAVAGATSYKMFRATTSNGQSTTPTASGISGTSYVDTGLTNGQIYYYKLAAVNVTGTGPNSAQKSATPNGSLARPASSIGSSVHNN